MNKKVEIFDTTLRDGEQAPENTMSKGQKLIIAKALEKLGVNIIEAGFPISSAEDFKAVENIARSIKRSSVCAMARCKHEDIDAAREALKRAVNPILFLFFPTSDIHLKVKFGITRKEALRIISEHLNYASPYFKKIIFGAEDATRSDINFLEEVFKLVSKNKKVFVLCIGDTTGYAQPDEIHRLVSKCVKKFPDKKIGIHCHDDLGLATANTLAAIKAGALHAQVTINGIGERAGNTALEEIIMALHTRSDFYKRRTNINLKEIYATSQLVYKTLKRPTPYEKPIVGVNNFRHEAGIHVASVLKNPKTYEILDPKSLLRSRELIQGRHSSKTRKFVRKNKILKNARE